MKNKIRLDGKYRQVNGARVLRVLCTDATGTTYPVLVQMEDKRVEAYTEYGKYYTRPSLPLRDDDCDLVEISPYDDIPIDAKGLTLDEDKVKYKRHIEDLLELMKADR